MNNATQTTLRNNLAIATQRRINAMLAVDAVTADEVLAATTVERREALAADAALAATKPAKMLRDDEKSLHNRIAVAAVAGSPAVNLLVLLALLEDEENDEDALAA